MKILAVNGSPHKNGNTVTLIEEIFRGAHEKDHQCEIVHLIDLTLAYCNWCGDCWDTTPGVCPIDDGFMEHLNRIFEADILIVATPSSTHSVTGYMKNWLDRFINSQLIFEVNENRNVTKHSRVPPGKKAIVIVQGCTDRLQETIEPIDVVMDRLEIPVIEKLIVAHVGLTEGDTINKRPDVMRRAFEIGRSLR